LNKAHEPKLHRANFERWITHADMRNPAFCTLAVVGPFIHFPNVLRQIASFTARAANRIIETLTSGGSTMTIASPRAAL
jgi:hypothetical protein